MARHYVIQDWQNAAEYSGEMIGKRLARSHEIFLPNGQANTALFSDESTKPVKPKLTAFEKICTADRSYEKLCQLSDALDSQLVNGELELADWAFARKQLDVKLEKGWQAVCRLRGWTNEPEQYPNQGLNFTLDLEHSKQRQYDYAVIPSGSVFAELQDGNIFKQCAFFVLAAACAMRKILDVSKNILEEGLI